MKRILITILSFILYSFSLSAQIDEGITVKAGTKVIEYFPVRVRYRYPQFINGQVVFKNGKVNSTRLNYNFLNDEMEFIQSRDTLAILDKKNINFIIVARDTFYFDHGYLELIAGGQVKVGLKQCFRLKDVQKKGAYGLVERGGSLDTYNSIMVGGNFYDLVPNEDWVFQKTIEYYFATPTSDFVLFSKKNVVRLFPQKEDKIKAYLKSNKVISNSKEDILRLADYLRKL